MNAALERAGSAERVDHRSLKAQGIARELVPHIGRATWEMERRGVETKRGGRWREQGAAWEPCTVHRGSAVSPSPDRRVRHTGAIALGIPAGLHCLSGCTAHVRLAPHERSILEVV